MRALLLPAIAAALMIGSVGPARAGSLPPLLVSARLYAWHHHWSPVDWGRMVNSEPLRFNVQVSTPYGTPASISVRAELRHLSWPGCCPVIARADVHIQLRETMRREHFARFQAIIHVPVTHPLQFSRVVITVKQGNLVRSVTSGVTFEPPMTPTEAAVTLTVPQTFSFCAARSRLRYLSYGLAVRGYVRGVPTGGDGPAAFVVLAHESTVSTNAGFLLQHHEGFGAGGFVNPPQGRLVTIAGGLDCRPQIRFGIVGSSK